MTRIFFLMTVAGLSLVSNQSFGQIQTTVQLPTVHVFSVGTTVLVPDRGSVFLGGVDRASYGSTTNGVPGLSKIPGLGRLFTNRGIGSEVSSSRAFASATIMDLDELDKSVLAEAAARRGATVAGGGATKDPTVERKAAFLAKHVAKTGRAQLQSASAPAPYRSK